MLRTGRRFSTSGVRGGQARARATRLFTIASRIGSFAPRSDCRRSDLAGSPPAPCDRRGGTGHVLASGEHDGAAMLGWEPTPRLVDGERNADRADPPRQPDEHREDDERHRDIVAQRISSHVPRSRRTPCARLAAFRGLKVQQDDLATVETDSAFSQAIREHLELKSRNSRLEGEMPLEHYLEEDPLENHPLFKSEEQARIEETMDGEPAAELSSEQLPWPGEETVENVEGPALDEALWSSGPRDFDWGD